GEDFNPYAAPSTPLDSSPAKAEGGDRSRGEATACLVIGLLCLVAAFIPPLIIGYLWAGLAAGRRSWNAPNWIEARVGVVLCLIALVLSVIITVRFLAAVRGQS